MPIKSYEEELLEVQAAISAIITGGQGYSIGGRSLSRASLGELYAREKYLRAMATRESLGGVEIRYAVPE